MMSLIFNKLQYKFSTKKNAPLQDSKGALYLKPNQFKVLGQELLLVLHL